MKLFKITPLIMALGLALCLADADAQWRRE